MSKFHNSNNDEYQTPDTEGWFIAFYTESGDSDYVKVDYKPTSEADAEATLLCILGYEEIFDTIYWDYNYLPKDDSVGLMVDMFGPSNGFG